MSVEYLFWAEIGDGRKRHSHLIHTADAVTAATEWSTLSKIDFPQSALDAFAMLDGPSYRTIVHMTKTIDGSSVEFRCHGVNLSTAPNCPRCVCM